MDRILVLPGDGIGPEVTRQARRVLEAAARRSGRKLAFEEDLIGGASIDALGTPLSDEAVERARSCRAVLLGAVGAAVSAVLEAGHRTADLAAEGERATGCSEMGDLVVAALESR